MLSLSNTIPQCWQMEEWEKRVNNLRVNLQISVNAALIGRRKAMPCYTQEIFWPPFSYNLICTSEFGRVQRNHAIGVAAFRFDRWGDRLRNNQLRKLLGQFVAICLPKQSADSGQAEHCLARAVQLMGCDADGMACCKYSRPRNHSSSDISWAPPHSGGTLYCADGIGRKLVRCVAVFLVVRGYSLWTYS